MQSEPTTEQMDEVTVEYRVSPGSNEWLSHVEMIDAVRDWSMKVPLTGAPSITVSKRVTVRGDDAEERALSMTKPCPVHGPDCRVVDTERAVD